MPPTFLSVQPLLTQAAGVQVTPTSGAPGAWAAVRIRGGSSLAGTDQPLYVVDNVPALNADFAPGVALGAGYSTFSRPEAAQPGANPLLFLAPEDVASITVLSGGVGTARYGMQGSNGVIQIVTKRGGLAGQKKPLRVRYAAFAGVQQVRQRYDLLSASQYAAVVNNAWTNTGYYPGQAPYATPASLNKLDPGTDWQAELFRPAFLQNHHLTLEGSSPSTRYALSADFLDQSGVVQHSGLRRYALRLNLDQQVGQRLGVFLNASAAHIAQTLPGQGAVEAALLAPPTLRARNPDGSYFQGEYYRYPGTDTFYNPLAMANEAGSDGTTRRLLLQAGGRYQLAPSFVLRLMASREQSRAGNQARFLTKPDNSSAPPAPLNVTTTALDAAVTVAQLQFDYDQTFDDHHLLLTAAAGYQRYERALSSEQNNAGYFAGSTAEQTTYSLLHASLVSTYTYRERYEVLASLRADDNRNLQLYPATTPVPASWLPGAEVRWHLHREAFLADVRPLSTVTVWAGLSQTGNAGLPALGLGSAVLSDFIRLSPGQGLTTLQPRGPTLAPSRTTQLEAAMRVGLWEDRVLLDFSAYRRTTAHVAVSQLVLLPAPSGMLISREEREASLRTQGLLLTVAGDWQLGKLSGRSRVAAALQQQQVQSVTPIAGVADVPGLVVGETPHPYLLFQRLPLLRVGEFDATGQPANGLLRYQTVGTNPYNATYVAQYQGTALPTRTLTFSQTLHLSRFDLDAQFDALAGHQLLNTTLARLDLPTGNTNGTTRLLDRWTSTHDDTDVPAAYANSLPARYDDAQLQSAANLRLSQLTISCALRPASAPHPVSVWVGGQNLFVLTSYRGFDPNVSSGGATLLAAGYDTNAYPVPRTWLLGVRASF
ncbi:TonB-dependent receptor plug domain-containing protein [Hymenobacter sp. M29]|uniref:TonB-dependent receptor plug domain-containing protein n=1 Tax=Hymenobacter mellowenesis TaxID=3063995 RepID=A0ABT9A6C8_9BACT|nr:TonB-dependent receptor plug domain-containing protein [Hymenobacter sp. M29]MDO7845396.1 TonB-dependent receptor plug domain-containing protein [Hymenobacter sp. M29]